MQQRTFKTPVKRKTKTATDETRIKHGLAAPGTPRPDSRGGLPATSGVQKHERTARAKTARRREPMAPSEQGHLPAAALSGSVQGKGSPPRRLVLEAFKGTPQPFDRGNYYTCSNRFLGI